MTDKTNNIEIDYPLVVKIMKTIEEREIIPYTHEENADYIAFLSGILEIQQELRLLFTSHHSPTQKVVDQFETLLRQLEDSYCSKSCAYGDHSFVEGFLVASNLADETKKAAATCNSNHLAEQTSIPEVK